MQELIGPIPFSARPPAGAPPLANQPSTIHVLHLLDKLLLGLPGVLAAQLVGAAAPQGPTRSVPVPQEFVTTQDDSLFSLMRSQEDVHQWEMALADRDAGKNAAAVERLHRLLQTEVGGAAAIGPDRFVGLRHAVVLTLANLTPAAAAAYEEVVHREAGALADADPTALRTEQLELLAERFPAATVGRRARLRLGDLALECGDGAAAAAHFAAALDAAPIGSELERRIELRQRRAAALMSAGSLRGRTDLPAEVAEVLAVLPPAQDRTDWRAFGGGSDGARPMAEPVGRPEQHFADDVQAPGFDYGGGATFAMQPTGGLDAIYVNTGVELLAIDPLGGRLLWSSPSPLREQTESRGREYPGSVNQNMVLAAATGEDVVVAALQVPDDSPLVRYQNAFTIMSRIPERRLFAFQRSTGKLLWSHFDAMDGPVSQRFRGHSSCGPPLVLGDTVYAPVHDRAGAIAFYVGAYDLHTGQPRWRRLICSSQQEVNMFGNARMEFAASPLCETDGLLLGSSNLGVSYAIERATGRLRWITAYEVIRMPPAQLQGQDPRTVFFQNSAPAVVDGVMCCTPLDSEFALGFDIATGEPLWRVPHQAKANGNNDVRWLCGALGDEFVLAGAGVVAVQARPATPIAGVPPLRQIRSREYLQSDDRGEQGRPALTDRWIWFPTSSGIKVFDATGDLAPISGNVRLHAPANLLLVDGLVVALANHSLEVLLDAGALRAGAERRVRGSPDDPAALLRLCVVQTALAPDDPDGRAAIEALCRRGIAACVRQGLPTDHPLHATFRRRLFDSAIARAELTSGAAGTELLAKARDLAPDLAAFLQVESLLIERSADQPAALRRELTLLLERAAASSYALPGAGGPLPVEAYVQWQRTLLAEDPRQQIDGWQTLLRQYGQVSIQGRPAAELARAAIDGLIERHGREVYAGIEAQAARALAESGANPEALRAVGTAFPHSRAAATAQRQLLDVAVAAGDLGTAVDVIALAGRTAPPSPNLLRRLLEAARLRGNLGLARGVASLLSAAPEPSDWPADGGRAFAAVAPEFLRAAPGAEPEAVRRVPSEVVAEIASPSPPLGFRLLPTIVDDGFARSGEAPLYVLVDDQVRAIDLHAPSRPTLFTYKSGIVDRLWLCGSTLVVPNLDRLAGIDARAGTAQWQFASPGRVLVCHGLVRGVLQVTQRDSDAEVILFGIEPLTGHVLYSRPLPAIDHVAAQPKPCDHDLLVLRPGGADTVAVDRVDPITGALAPGFVLGPAVSGATHVPIETLRSSLMLQSFAASADLLFVPVDSTLSRNPPQLVAVAHDGSIAWSWNGTRERRLPVAALRGDRLVVVEVGADGGRAVVLQAASGAPVRELALGADVQVLNWQRQRYAAPAPPALLCSDLDRRGGDRRLVFVPIDDGLPMFAKTVGGASEEIIRTPWFGDDLLVFGLHADRGQGPVRLFALHLGDRSGALPERRNYLLLPVPPRPPHELGTSGPYTVLVTDTRLYVLGDGKDTR